MIWLLSLAWAQAPSDTGSPAASPPEAPVPVAAPTPEPPAPPQVVPEPVATPARDTGGTRDTGASPAPSGPPVEAESTSPEPAPPPEPGIADPPTEFEPQGPPSPGPHVVESVPPPTADGPPGATEATDAGPTPIERTLDRRIERVLERLVPTLSRRGPQALFGLALFALLGLGGASAARTFRSRLRAQGLLPSLATGIEIFGRGLAVVALVTILVALLPVGIVPTLTWIAIGAAVAVGWSLREILPDVLAWIVLATEGQLVRGVWVRTGDLHGAVDSFTLRSISIIDAYGQRISIPNRVLLRQPIQAATDSFPKTHVVTRLDPDLDPELVRAALREAALLSPWLAPSATPEIGQDPTDPTRWQVAIRLLEGAYEDDFAGSFPERVREVLAARRGGAA